MSQALVWLRVLSLPKQAEEGVPHLLQGHAWNTQLPGMHGSAQGCVVQGTGIWEARVEGAERMNNYRPKA